MTEQTDGDATESQSAPDPEPEAPAPETTKRARRAPGDTPAPQSFDMPVKDLRAALKGLTDVVEARNTIPILSNVLLELAPARLTLTATDLDLWMVRHVSIETESAGDFVDGFATTLCAKMARQIADKLPAEAMVTITYDAGKVTFAAGRARFKVPTLPPEDFPRPSFAEPRHQFDMPSFDLQTMLAAVRFAMSNDETRFYLGGVYLHATTAPGPTGDGEGTLMVLRGVTTDGSRLATFDVTQPDGAGALDGVIVPRKTVKALDGLLDGFSGMVDVSIGELAMVVDLGDTVVFSKLIDGTFPDYTRVIPTGNDRTVTFDPKAMIEAVGRVTLMAGDKSRILRLDFAQDLMTLSSRSPEQGEAVEELPCDYDGPVFHIGFNGGYMAEICAHLQGDSATMAMADAAAPTLLRDFNPEARGLFVLMPMRV